MLGWLELFNEMGSLGLSVVFFILCIFVLSIGFIVFTWGKYGALSKDLDGVYGKKDAVFKTNILNSIVEKYKNAAITGNQVNTQAIIESSFNLGFKKYLIHERFIKSTVSILITCGIFGTFLMLFYSAGDIFSSISSGNSDNLGVEISAPFIISLLGILLSLVFNFINIIFNVENKRENLIIAIEEYLDNNVFVLKVNNAKNWEDELSRENASDTNTMADFDNKIERILEKTMEGFLQKLSGTVVEVGMKSTVLDNMVEKFDNIVEKFDNSLKNFKETVKDINDFDVNFKERVKDINDFNVNFKETIKDINDFNVNFKERVKDINDFNINFKETVRGINDFNVNFKETAKSINDFNVNFNGTIDKMDAILVSSTETIIKSSKEITSNYGSVESFSNSIKEAAQEIVSYNKKAIEEITKLVSEIKSTSSTVGELGMTIQSDLSVRTQDIKEYQEKFSMIVSRLNEEINLLSSKTAESFANSLQENSKNISESIITNIDNVVKELFNIMDEFKENEKVLAKTIVMLPDQILTYNETAAAQVGRQLDEVKHLCRNLR